MNGFFCFIFMGLEYRIGRSNVSAWGMGEYLTQLFLGWSFFLTLYSLSFFHFSVIFFAITLRLRSPKDVFACIVFFLFFFLPMCYILHWLSCVTTNMELSHTTILVRGRRWGKSRFPYQAFLCVLPATIVLRDLKRVLVSHPLERPGVSRSPKVCSSGY